ncbi:MAG: alanine racemase, partial [Spirochaetales bacterium]|nr:alanine racemase [Spirochaetales bacterium]
AYRGEDDAFNRRQLSLFMTLLDNLAEQGLRFPKVHIANSDAVNNLPWTYKKPFTHVRVGLNLHGSFESEGNRAVTLESIFTLKTRVVSIRTLPAGMTVGYGRTYTLKQPTRVGTIAAGYADGLPLALSNRGYVLVRGKPCPVLGRLSMDYTTISLENAPEASRGDEVVCLGRDGDEEITVDAWAQLKGTHAYDIICSFGNRVSRRYI